MFDIKINIVCFIVFNCLIQIQSLVELSPEEDNDIVSTESAVRNTVNRLFASLKLKRVKTKTRFGEFAAIHNIFVAITLQDHDNLKELARKTRVDNIDNKTQNFITQINEALNEDKSHEETDDVYVTKHIETFIKKLEYLKHKYGFDNNDANFSINSEILDRVNDIDQLRNGSEANDTTVEEDDNVLSNYEYWKPSSRRIYEGHREKISRFPFMASVQFFKKFQCGGSIIKSDLVITAASCLQLAWNNRFFRENPAFLSVQIGCERYEGGDENIAVLEVYFHPEYNPKNLMNNLAIMRLVRHIKFGFRVRKVKKIDFDRDAWPLPQTTNGITVVGWGARSVSNIIKNPWSQRLAYAELDYYPLRECQDVYSREYVTFRNFCAGFFSKGGGACNRDVGGPGIVRGILMGVISFGSPNCGAPDAPTVFTKLGYYAEWIEKILEMEPSTGRARTTERTTKITNEVYNKYITEDYPFKISPVTKYPIENKQLVKAEDLPIRTLDALRSLDDNLVFKDFVKTMFGSDEIKEYLEQYEYTTDGSSEEKETKEDKKKKETTRGKATTTTEPTTVPDVQLKIPDNFLEANDDSEPGSNVKMVTTIEKFDRFESSSREFTTPAVVVHYTALDSEKEDENNMEENIAKLINEIDIQELLASDSDEGSSMEKIKKQLEDKTIAEKLEKLDESSRSSSDESSSGDDEDSEDSGYKLVSLIDVKNGNVKNEDEGLSIPAESFKDFTFRHNTSNTGILDIFSQNDLLKLLTEVVADATGNKQIKYK